MNTSEIPSHRCECGRINFQATGFDDYVPQPGDASLCEGCGKIMIFTRKMTLRRPSPKERLYISLLPPVISAQIYIAGGWKSPSR